METVDVERDKSLKTLSRYHNTMVERFNNPETYLPIDRKNMMETFFTLLEEHINRYGEKRKGGEHLDKRKK